MIRIISLVGGLGLSALFVAACSGEDTTSFTSVLPLQPAAGSTGVAGRPGSGRGGTAGAPATGAGGNTSDPGASAGSVGVVDAGDNDAAVVGGADAGELDAGPARVDTSDAGSLIPCAVAADCDDQSDCTSEACVGGFCDFTPLAIGTACGDTTTADECTQPDTCDGLGVCLTNNQPDGTLCADGHCSLTGVCDCAVERITTVPYDQQWQTTADTEVDVLDLQPCQLCAGTPDHIVVFTAPADATYRITATSIAGDVELTVFAGECGAAPVDLICGQNVDPDNGDLNDRLELELAAGDTVTVVLGEQCEENGSEGRLSIDLAPEQP
jgi:hypothetical protein